MIEKIGHFWGETLYSVLCDKENCTVEIVLEETNFQQLLDYLNKEGWKSQRNENRWEHFCPLCSREEIKK